MSKKKQKYYVVWRGNQPGVYKNWTDCQLQIKAFPGALYKAFINENEAQLAYKMGYEAFREQKEKSETKQNTEVYKDEIIWHSISVDAAWNSVAKDMEYRGVWTESGEEIFRQGPFPDGTNNVGEFLALVHALAYCHKTGKKDLVIYTDSRTALAWVRNKKVKTTLAKTPKNRILFDLLERAILWLKTHSYKNKIIKWETKKWGEIPADFGRK